MAACEALYKLSIYYFSLSIKIKRAPCFCIQYTFNPADLDFAGFKSSGELAGFPTFPPVPLNKSSGSCSATLPFLPPHTAGLSTLERERHACGFWLLPQHLSLFLSTTESWMQLAIVEMQGVDCLHWLMIGA